MEIKTLINLIAGGYRASEIKDMEKPEIIADLLKSGIKKDDIQEYVDLLQETGEDDHTDDSPEDPDPEPENEWKTKYESLLKKTQADNINKDMSGKDEETAESILLDILGG